MSAISKNYVELFFVKTASNILINLRNQLLVFMISVGQKKYLSSKSVVNMFMVINLFFCLYFFTCLLKFCGCKSCVELVMESGITIKHNKSRNFISFLDTFFFINKIQIQRNFCVSIFLQYDFWILVLSRSRFLNFSMKQKLLQSAYTEVLFYLGFCTFIGSMKFWCGIYTALGINASRHDEMLESNSKVSNSSLIGIMGFQCGSCEDWDSSTTMTSFCVWFSQGSCQELL